MRRAGGGPSGTSSGLDPSPAAGPFTVAQHLADFISVLDAVGSAHCVVLGHSWGTHLALQAAIARPDRVRALVLVDPFGVTGGRRR
jgi:pimeloyl-ACP methyl ester carboxylesterase